MTVLAPATWWRGLGGWTQSGSAVQALAWALYDFANTIFSFAIVSFAMSLWTIRLLDSERDGTFWFTTAVSVSVLLNAVVSPVLGAMSDRVGRRRPFLAVFTALCLGATVVIGLVDIRLGLVAFALANFAYQAALIYYDATLPDVATAPARGRLSGIGVALGYCGTLLVGALLLLGVSTSEGESTPATFVLVGALFALFAAPLFLLVPERRRVGSAFRIGDAARSWAQLAETVRHARQSPGLLRFVVARFFYSDPINTAIVVMSAFAVHAVGFTEGQALQVLLILTVVAVIASFGWGRLSDRWGPRRALFAVLGLWAIGLVILALTLSPIPFLVAGALLGAGLGGAGVVDRLMLLRLSPPDRVGEMFGLYGLVGKFSAVVGPFVYGLIVRALLEPLGNAAYQVAIASLLVLLLVGMAILRGVPEGAAE